MTDNTIVNCSSQNLAHTIDFYCFKGRPRNLDQENSVNLLVNHGFLTGYSSLRKQPIWSAYRVAEARRDVDYERPHLFYEDNRLPEEDQISTWTFGRVNDKKYDRGHMVPNFAVNKQFGRLAQMETFFMSNICPQEAATNQGVWQKLEKRIVSKYAKDHEHIWVYVGPIFGKNPKKIRRNNGTEVHIPDSFYCILVDPLNWPHDDIKNVRFLVLEIPQDAGRVELDESRFPSTIRSIEQRTNIDFFPHLTDSEKDAVELREWDSWQ